MHTCIHTYIHTYILFAFYERVTPNSSLCCPQLHTYIHIYICCVHTFIHTYTYIHIHMHTLRMSSPSGTQSRCSTRRFCRSRTVTAAPANARSALGRRSARCKHFGDASATACARPWPESRSQACAQRRLRHCMSTPPLSLPYRRCRPNRHTRKNNGHPDSHRSSGKLRHGL